MKCARLKSDTAVSELVEKKYEAKHKRLVHQEFRHDCCWLVKFCWFYFCFFCTFREGYLSFLPLVVSLFCLELGWRIVGEDSPMHSSLRREMRNKDSLFLCVLVKRIFYGLLRHPRKNPSPMYLNFSLNCRFLSANCFNELLRRKL